jgi:hypothetical protein
VKKQLQISLVARANTASDFKTAITFGGTTKFYFGQAPKGTTGKYAVLSGVSNPQSRDSGSLYEDCFYQIACYHISDVTEDIGSTSGVHDLADACEDLFGDCESADTPMTVTGYELISNTLLNTIPPLKIEGGYVIVKNFLARLQKDR